MKNRNTAFKIKQYERETEQKQVAFRICGTLVDSIWNDIWRGVRHECKGLSAFPSIFSLYLATQPVLPIEDPPQEDSLYPYSLIPFTIIKK